MRNYHLQRSENTVVCPLYGRKHKPGLKRGNFSAYRCALALPSTFHGIGMTAASADEQRLSHAR